MGLVLFLLMGVVLLGCWALFHLLVFGDSGYLSSSPCFRGRGVDYQSMGLQNGMGGLSGRGFYSVCLVGGTYGGLGRIVLFGEPVFRFTFPDGRTYESAVPFCFGLV